MRVVRCHGGLFDITNIVEASDSVAGKISTLAASMLATARSK